MIRRLALLGAVVFAHHSAAAQGTLVTDSVNSPGLVGNVLGDSPMRRTLVYLPPSYNRDSARRYPVLYLLHGATSVPEEWIDGSYQGMNLGLVLDSLIAAKAIPEMIVVMPNADNKLGAAFYANSPATGNWEDFIVRDVVGYVDRKYRTVARGSQRALVGHSMGGFGALAIAFKHPRQFGMVYGVSPCCLGFVGRYDSASPAWPVLLQAPRWQDVPDRFHLMLGMAAALDGDRTNPRLFAELPFAIGTGRITVRNDRAQRIWLEKMPPGLASAMVRRGDRPPVIVMESGSEEKELLEGVALLRARLDSLHITYTDTTFTGGHIDRVRERFTQHMLPTVGKWFVSGQR